MKFVFCLCKLRRVCCKHKHPRTDQAASTLSIGIPFLYEELLAILLQVSWVPMQLSLSGINLRNWVPQGPSSSTTKYFPGK